MSRRSEADGPGDYRKARGKDMTTFRRSGHYRTSSGGNTHWVAGHDVSRDYSPPLSSTHSSTYTSTMRAADPILSTDRLERVLVVPNARCPVCGAPVIFYRSPYDGRVFFDPPLGPPWPKHPCTISDDSKVMQPPPASAKTTARQAIVRVTFHPRPTGTVVGLHSDNGSEWVRADVDLSRRYFGRVWPERPKNTPIRGIHLLSDDFDPVLVDATPCGKPKPLTDRDRIVLSRRREETCLKVFKRIGGVTRGKSGTAPGCGAFAVGMLGRARVAVLFAPTDFTTQDAHLDDDGFASVAVRWDAVRAFLSERGILAGDYFELDQLVVVTDDPLGHRSGWLTGLRSAVPRGTSGIPWSRTHPEAHEITDEARVGRIEFVDARDPKVSSLTAVPTTCNQAVKFDSRFCETLPGADDKDRWAGVQRAVSHVGLVDAFRVTDAMLKAAGWSVREWVSVDADGHRRQLEVVYVRDAAASSHIGPSIRFNYELSASLRGVAVIALNGLADRATMQQPVEEHLHVLRTSEDVERMLVAIGFPATEEADLRPQ